METVLTNASCSGVVVAKMPLPWFRPRRTRMLLDGGRVSFPLTYYTVSVWIFEL